MPDLDWPAARRAIDTAISRARREIEITVRHALNRSPITAAVILDQVRDSLDDIDQTIPTAEDDDDA